jgi:hypothetical protein
VAHLVATCAALALVVATATANADEPARTAAEREITVVPSSCDDLPWTGVSWEELLVIELSGDGTKARITTREGAASIAPSSPRVSIELDRCAASATNVTISIELGSRRSERTLALARLVSSARARAIAIAAAELVHGTPLDEPAPVTSPPPPAPPQPPPPPVVVAPSPPPPAPAVVAFAAGESRFFPEGDATMFGARLGVRVPLVGWSAIGVDAGALSGSADDPLGKVTLTLASVGLSALVVARTSGFDVALGPRFELGSGWFRGHALAATTLASTAVSPIALASLTAAASFRVAGDLGATVAVDGGAAVYGFGARADDRSVAGMRGPMLSLRLGLAWDRGPR